MPAPTERSLLLDHFRPPDGYRFDSAVGTTYSLDLVALMMVPLAFTFLDIETAAGDPCSSYPTRQDRPLVALRTAGPPCYLRDTRRRGGPGVESECHVRRVSFVDRDR